MICELTTREGKEGISGNNDPMSGNDGAHTVMRKRHAKEFGRFIQANLFGTYYRENKNFILKIYLLLLLLLYFT